MVLLPLDLSDFLDMWFETLQSEPVEGGILEDFLGLGGLGTDDIVAIIHFVGLIRFAGKDLTCRWMFSLQGEEAGEERLDCFRHFRNLVK